ncbi:MAG: hypothetical protein H7Y11_14715, partial [Armatimonadetes bacterium]|nr:hypothetical protein [Anaerolineae bacterium]
MGFETVASGWGFIIGLVCGLAPLGIGVHYRKYIVGIGGLVACVLSGFACGFLGGIPMIVLSTAV